MSDNKPNPNDLGSLNATTPTDWKTGITAIDTTAVQIADHDDIGFVCNQIMCKSASAWQFSSEEGGTYVDVGADQWFPLVGRGCNAMWVKAAGAANLQWYAAGFGV